MKILSTKPTRNWFAFAEIVTREMWAVHSGDWKLVTREEEGEFRTDFLYELSRDPLEQIDRSGAKPQLRAQLLTLRAVFRTLQPEDAIVPSTPPEGWEPPPRWQLPEPNAATRAVAALLVLAALRSRSRTPR